MSDINGNHKFSFDRVFGSEASQKDVFLEVAVPSVDGVFNGYNGTIFAYGQTGSGKSFTMEGANLYDEKLKGLIPRMFEYLFSKIGAADSKIEFTIKCSYLEIYMERICDLLDGTSILTSDFDCSEEAELAGERGQGTRLVRPGRDRSVRVESIGDV